MLRDRVFDQQLAAGHRGEADVGTDFDVIAGNRELSTL